MNSMMFARVLRVFAVLALLVILGEMQRATFHNVEMIFATEIVLIIVLILSTKIIEDQKMDKQER